MNQKKFAGTFLIVNEKGLHTRPSTELVKCASMYKSHITLKHKNLVANAKSLLSILMLAASRGTRISIEAVGLDSKEAVEAIIDLSKNKFHIKY